jgi:hypothetical protein
VLVRVIEVITRHIADPTLLHKIAADLQAIDLQDPLKVAVENVPQLVASNGQETLKTSALSKPVEINPFQLDGF